MSSESETYGKSIDKYSYFVIKDTFYFTYH